MGLYTPERGDVIWLNFNPQTGHEQSGKRPAVVLSPLEYNEKVGLVICCPITNQVKAYPFEVIIPEGIKIGGVVLADQVKSLDWRVRQAEYIDKLSEIVLKEVLQKLHVLIT